MKRQSHGRPTRRKTPALHEAVIVDHHSLMALPGVRNVAVGMKEVRRRVTRRACVKIYVAEKKPLRALEHKPFPKSTTILVPSGKTSYKAHRVPTDIVETNGF